MRLEPTAEADLRTSEFGRRLGAVYDELKWLYVTLYGENYPALDHLCRDMEGFYAERLDVLKASDRAREADGDWFRRGGRVGMMLYTEAFAGDLPTLTERLDYIASLGVNLLHLMPLFDSPDGKSDGGYAVSDFRRVRYDLGTVSDLTALAARCREKEMLLCLDFVMNHTSDRHVWARAARAGDPAARDRYFFFPDRTMPDRYEETVPQVFPTTAPGNFTRLEDGSYVMTTFYPFQWDLNYKNPDVFHEMVCHLLFMANRGVDVIRLDAVPYIWKEPGTDCRNRPEVHTLVRMMRLVCEAVCPGVLLLGEVVMAPDKVAPYFGTQEKPECQMLYNVTSMASVWHTLATGDTALLRSQWQTAASLPRSFVFLNYVRCHDDIGWGLDYPFLSGQGVGEVSHKRFLNDFYTGRFFGSEARGETYNDDAVTGDARLCGTTASLCGLEEAERCGDEAMLDRAVSRILLLHAVMLSQSGIPMLYSGDEVGQTNDYTYHEDPARAGDSRNLHRGRFRPALAALRHEEGTPQKRIFDGLRRLLALRAAHAAFDSDASVRIGEGGHGSVLCLMREKAGEQVIACFNFSDRTQIAWTDGLGVPQTGDGLYTDPIGNTERYADGIALPPYGFLWLTRGEHQNNG